MLSTTTVEATEELSLNLSEVANGLSEAEGLNFGDGETLEDFLTLVVGLGVVTEVGLKFTIGFLVDSLAVTTT